MKFRVQTDNPQAAAMQHSSVARLAQALRRLRWLVARVTVRLDSIEDSRSAADKRCSVEVTTRSVGHIVVAATARSWQESVQIAAARVRQIVVARFRKAITVRAARQPRSVGFAPVPKPFGRMAPTRHEQGA